MKIRPISFVIQSFMLVFNLWGNAVWLYASLRMADSLLVLAQLLIIGIVMLLPAFIMVSYVMYRKRWNLHRYLYSLAISLAVSALLYSYHRGLW
jgi:uncharacterized membrane protein